MIRILDPKLQKLWLKLSVQLLSGDEDQINQNDIRTKVVFSQVWDIFQNKHMFNALDEDQKYFPSHHAAKMVGYLGLPTPQFLQ